jgi:carbonic anhydrase
MRLFEAVIDANHRALAGESAAGLHPKDFADSLPLVALTCIDPRLNPLMPAVLGIPEEQFIWLRNAGNIITSQTSSTMRSLALACSIKGGREIAVIGHTDCRVRQTSVAELTDRFRALGVERSRLPDNLNEFFGLFASERQNVMRGVDFVRQSPLIGPKIPVHGLLVELETGKLEWLVNGYQTIGGAAAHETSAPRAAAPGPVPLDNLPAFNLGEMKFPDFKIGDTVVATAAPSQPKVALTPAQPIEAQPGKTAVLKFNKSTLFKVVGNDQKIYGPVSGKDIEEWLAEERISAASRAQKVGYQEWKPLASFAEAPAHPGLHMPPPLVRGKRSR